jgi:hypothetical protein
MEEELEVLDLHDLIETHSSKNIEKLFAAKKAAGFKITVVVKRFFF